MGLLAVGAWRGGGDGALRLELELDLPPLPIGITNEYN